MQTPPVIHYIPISELNPAPYNPRTWDEEALKQLCESITKFGFCQAPLFVDMDSK